MECLKSRVTEKRNKKGNGFKSWQVKNDLCTIKLKIAFHFLIKSFSFVKWAKTNRDIKKAHTFIVICKYF